MRRGRAGAAATSDRRMCAGAVRQKSNRHDLSGLDLFQDPSDVGLVRLSTNWNDSSEAERAA